MTQKEERWLLRAFFHSAEVVLTVVWSFLRAKTGKGPTSDLSDVSIYVFVYLCVVQSWLLSTLSICVGL